MQVKKFEAKNMKEALLMVKNELGPEAIILAARDVGPRFGIKGEKSVEVTAAISEVTLRNKQMAERRMNEQSRQKFSASPARSQKQFIDKVINKIQTEAHRKPITSQRYIEIDNEERSYLTSGGISAEERIRSAAQSAFAAAQEVVSEPDPPPAKKTLLGRSNQSNRSNQPSQSPSVGPDVQQLREEIQYLRSLIERFQNVPQNFVSLHPGAENGVPYELSQVYEKLVRSGISQANVVKILKVAQEGMPPAQIKKPAMVEAWIARYLLDATMISENRVVDRYHVFCGASGQGKTSSMIKFASHLAIVEKRKIAIVTTDAERIGATEQLKIYAQILNIQFFTIKTPEDWIELDQRLRQVDHILVDMPGANLKSMAQMDLIRSLLPSKTGGRRIHFVQSVFAKDSDCFEIARRYQSIGCDDVIFTGLDQSVQHGLIYNFQQEFGIPLHSFGTGPHIPEDFEPATKERVVDLIFKLTKVKREG